MSCGDTIRQVRTGLLFFRCLVLCWTLLGLAGSTAQAKPKPVVPEWNKGALRNFLTRVQVAGQNRNVQAKDNELVNVCGSAYNVRRQPGEPTEDYAKRILKKRSPEQAQVKEGQWLLALMQRFYADVSKRCDRLARFELDRRDRQYLENMGKQTREVSKQLGQMVQVAVQGLEGFMESLPVSDGAEPQKIGAMVKVKGGGTIVIERMDRVHFKEHRPPSGAKRTTKGALKEVYSAQKQYNITAQMFMKYDKKWRKSRGHVQVLIPGQYPALYLNEIVKGSLEAGMHTLHLMTMSKQGELRELELALAKKKRKRRRRKRKKATVKVRCANDMSMQKCVQKVKHAASQGAPWFVL